MVGLAEAVQSCSGEAQPRLHSTAAGSLIVLPRGPPCRRLAS